MNLKAIIQAAKAAIASSLMTAAALVALLAYAALRDLDGLLRGMHGDADPSHGMASLGKLGSWLGDPSHTNGVLEVWQAYPSGEHAASALEVTRWFAAVDLLVFLPAYVVWLGLWFSRSRARIDTLESLAPGDRPGGLVKFFEERGIAWDRGFDPYRLASQIGTAVLAALVVFELAEGYASVELVEDAAGGATEPSGFLLGLLWVATAGKWLATAFVVGVAIVLGWLRVLARQELFRRARAAGDPPSALETVWRGRVHLAVVAVLAAILLGHEQMPDVIRRWTAVQLGWALGGALLLALVMWAGTRRLCLASRSVRGPAAWSFKATARATVAFLALAVASLLLDLRTDRNIGWGLAIPAVFLVVVLVLNRLLTPNPARGPEPPMPNLAARSVMPRLLASAVLVVVALAIVRASFGYAVYTEQWTWEWLWLGLAVVGAVMSSFFKGVPVLREPLALAVGGAAVGYLGMRLAAPNEELHPVVLVATALLLTGFAWRLYPALAGMSVDRYLWRIVGGLAAVAVTIAWALLIVEPWATGERLGGIGLLMGFLILASLVGGLLVWATDVVEAPLHLRILQRRRWPVLTLLVLWFLVASQLDNGGFHDVRVAETPASRAPSLQEAFDCWRVKNGLLTDDVCKPANITTPPAGGVPLVFVSTAGGGIRAAYWTALVVDCVFEAGPEGCDARPQAPDWTRSNALFAASGISGGSLGLASYAAYLTQKAGGDRGPWVRDRLDADSLSAMFGWWLFVEAPRALLRFQNPMDRAEVLERGWERPWGGDGSPLADGLYESWDDHPQQPLLLLNGTSVEDGCRFNTSVLDANVEFVKRPSDCRSSEPFDGPVSQESVLGATRDLADFLCRDELAAGSDVPLSTAALLSGRFPFVSPSGRLERQCDRPGDTEKPTTYIVDGGYLEPSGAGTILELAAGLEPLIEEHNTAEATRDHCIVPVFVQIDNGASTAAEAAPKRPRELTVPLATVFATRGARGAGERADAGFRFNRGGFTRDGGPFSDRYVHFRNLGHPGPQAPLGWTLSQNSMADLERQLDHNADALRELRELFAAARAGRLGCE